MKIKMTKISLDINKQDNQKTEQIATKLGLKKASLIRMWIKEKLDEY